MFNFIIVTNKITDEIDKTLEILLDTKTIHDTIDLVNYHTYHNKYRSTEGIKYHHIKKPLHEAVNTILPSSSNVVIIESNVRVSKNFVKNLYEYYNFNNFNTIRMDSGNDRFVESDPRIGSKITPSSFTSFTIAFNTTYIHKLESTPKDTAKMVLEIGVPLDILNNVRVFKNISSSNKGGGVTVFIPSKSFKDIDAVKKMLLPNDRLFEFVSNGRTLTKFVNQKIIDSPNDCIILVDPNSKANISGIINKIRSLHSQDNCISIKSTDDDMRWLSFSKKKYKPAGKIFPNIQMFQKDVMSYITPIEYIDSHEKVIVNNVKMIKPIDRKFHNGVTSIIIPFMYNGDRWPLFQASIKCLHNFIKEYKDIEIIVHETAPTRFLQPDFIEQYNIVYLYTEYHGLFHRALALNIPARFIAKGDTFVFFDADLLITKKWVKEVRECDKTKYYIGWGKMTNLDEKGTKTYLQEGKIINNIERIRKPSGNSAAGGINIIPRNMFFDAGGWPESYKDKGYGGEDNSYTFKLKSLGFIKD